MWIIFPEVKIYYKVEVAVRRWLMLENTHQPILCCQGSCEAFIGWYRDGTHELCQLGEVFQWLDVLSLFWIASSPGIHKHFHLHFLPFLSPHSMPQQVKFTLFQAHAPGFPTFSLLLKFFAPSGMPICLFLCQISKYYWSLRPPAKSFFSMKSSLICLAGNGHSTFSVSFWWNIPSFFL